jgi:hypothetical protein
MTSALWASIVGQNNCVAFSILFDVGTVLQHLSMLQYTVCIPSANAKKSKIGSSYSTAQYSR